MTLDKAIEHGKEHRKPYRGSDDWEKDNRLYRVNKLEEKAKQDSEYVEEL